MLAYVSLWSADLLALGEAVDRLGEVADGFHVDVFDGHNVPELLFGPDLVAALRARTTTLLDVHLNVSDPDFWAPRFIEAGADMVTVQSGASKDIAATLGSIRSAGAQPSLGLELHEPVEQAEGFFDAIDRVLVMGTVIGIKGAQLDPTTPGRVSALVGARAARAGGPLRGRDREALLELSIEDALAGGRRRLTVDRREVSVNFPAGVRDGQLIRLAGQGGEGRDGGPPGDLFLRVALKPHPRFRRRGDDDLDVEVPITPSEAALGATVAVETPNGTARVRVPAGSSSGRRLRLRGRGLPKRGGGSGDLHAIVKIVVPKELSDRERELYEQLAESSGADPREV